MNGEAERHRAGRAGVAARCGALVLSFAGVGMHAHALDVETATFDELFFHAQRYGTTAEKRAAKRVAQQELLARGPEALQYLMEHVHIENVWGCILVERLILKLDKEEAAAGLLAFVNDEQPVTRRFAIYFLGFLDTPGHVAIVLPFLDDDEAAGAAIRTLGKWRAREAVPRLVTFLSDEKERRRVLAANALKDVGATQAVPGLIQALSDPVFTVRRAAAGALSNMDGAVEPMLLAALDEAEGAARRELVRILGERRCQKAIRPLRRLLSADDRLVRMDAAQALGVIDPEEAVRWWEKADIGPVIDTAGPFVSTRALQAAAAAGGE